MSEIKAIENLRVYANKVIASPQYILGESFDLERFADAIEREIAEKYMPAALDCEKNPWTVDDGKFIAKNETMARNLVALRYELGDGVGVWLLEDDTMCTFYAHECRHVKDRTVEDVLREYGDAVDRLGQANVDMSTYAVELREMLDGYVK